LRRFTTYERAEEQPLVVIKKDGRREIFSRGKILAGLLRACEKRPVPLSVLEKTVADIELELQNEGHPEISSQRIGELVMESLRKLDEIAYVRFASVYRQFTDIDNFLRELEKLLKVPRDE
jgi:transcriptional repressor NrdR